MRLKKPAGTIVIQTTVTIHVPGFITDECYAAICQALTDHQRPEFQIDVDEEIYGDALDEINEVRRHD